MSDAAIGIDYNPIIKGKGFNPSPVAKGGIPDFANSFLNPHAEGTIAHEQWWLEQFDRCKNGYTTGGIFIPGRYYYYLNFCRITTIKRGRHHPEFVDLDLEFFRLVEQAKLDHKGIISIKARRRGLSEKAVAVMDHGLRFTPEGYAAGVCAGLEEYEKDFYAKLMNANYDKAPELRLQFLTEDKELVAGWNEQTSSGFVEKGSKNTVYHKTMFMNENVFKGKLLWDCVFEEAGEFKKLLGGYGSTKSCFAVGNEMHGTPFVYGTGGNMKTSSRDFAEMWSEADSYGLLKFEVMAQRMMMGCFVGSVVPDSETGGTRKPDNCPNIFAKYKDYEYEQLLGCEDIIEADRVLLENRRVLRLAKNKKPYWDAVQNEPRNVGEAFLRFSGNNFDAEAINEQQMYLDLLPNALYSAFVLSWKKDADGKLKQPLQVEATPAAESVPREMCVMIHRDGMPKRQYRNLYVHGIDSYDQDIARESKSLGGSLIMARKGNDINKEKRVPLAIYFDRPKRKELFYDICLMMSVFWDTLRNTMIDVGKPLIIKHYETNGCTRFLSPRPKSFESESSEQSHKYGMMFTGGIKSKSQAISLLQTWVVDEVDTCVFPIILKNLVDYDVEQKDSDWDIVDALMLALIRDVDMKREATKEDPEADDPFDLGEWVEDSDGNVINTKKEFRAVKENDENRKQLPVDPFLKLLEEGKI